MTPEEGCIFSYSLGTAMYVLGMLGESRGVVGPETLLGGGRGRFEGRRRFEVFEGSQSTFT